MGQLTNETIKLRVLYDFTEYLLGIDDKVGIEDLIERGRGRVQLAQRLLNSAPILVGELASEMEQSEGPPDRAADLGRYQGESDLNPGAV